MSLEPTLAASGDIKGWIVGGAIALLILVWPLVAWIQSRPREKALAALKAYAEHGREPPPELLQLIAQPERDVWGMGDMSDWGYASPKGPMRKWEGVIISFGLAGGFGVAAWLNHAPFTHPFWVVTLVAGVLGVASLAYAIVASLNRQ